MHKICTVIRREVTSPPYRPVLGQDRGRQLALIPDLPLIGSSKGDSRDMGPCKGIKEAVLGSLRGLKKAVLDWAPVLGGW